MHYDLSAFTTRQYEADRATALHQRQRLAAAECAQKAQQVPSPLRGWWTGLCRWTTSLRARHGQSAQPAEDPSVS
ncbi:MAG TPA: hypothetical protein VGW38_21575 [Chloroflexota bacterium]|nr:hypothetical protein [Chloroflexota bacterium]